MRSENSIIYIYDISYYQETSSPCAWTPVTFWRCLSLKEDCTLLISSRYHYSRPIYEQANAFIFQAYFDHQFITKKIVLDFPPAPWQKFIRSMLNNFLTSANHRTMEFIECIGFQHHTVRFFILLCFFVSLYLHKTSSQLLHFKHGTWASYNV